jgi:hypothetical protein
MAKPADVHEAESEFYAADAEARELTERIRIADAALKQEAGWTSLQTDFGLSFEEVDMLSLLVATEADSRLGLANRLLAARARRVCLAFPIAGREGSERRAATMDSGASRANRPMRLRSAGSSRPARRPRGAATVDESAASSRCTVRGLTAVAERAAMGASRPIPAALSMIRTATRRSRSSNRILA